MQADIGETTRIDRGKCLGHAVDERLDTDEADLRVALRLRHQMLAAAEPTFQAHIIDAAEQRPQIRGRRNIEVKCQPRQQGL
jgi:hypothetical protein